MPVESPKSLPASVFLFNKSATIFFFDEKIQKNAKIRLKHRLNSGVVNKQHKLRHWNSGREKFGSAHRHEKKRSLVQPTDKNKKIC